MPLIAAAALALNCWTTAAVRYHIPAELLYSMGQVESGHNARAIAYARDGSYSIGVMQINSKWFPELAKYGVTEQDLYKPCVNIHVGAWILAQEVNRFGYSWEAIGAYYAGAYRTEKGRKAKLNDYRQYSEKVLRRWERNRSKKKQEVRS